MELGTNAEEFTQNMLARCDGADAKAWFLFFLSQPLGELRGKSPRDCMHDANMRARIYELFFGQAGLRPGLAPWAREDAVRTADGGWMSRSLVRTPDGYAWVPAQ